MFSSAVHSRGVTAKRNLLCLPALFALQWGPLLEPELAALSSKVQWPATSLAPKRQQGLSLLPLGNEAGGGLPCRPEMAAQAGMAYGALSPCRLLNTSSVARAGLLNTGPLPAGPEWLRSSGRVRARCCSAAMSALAGLTTQT